MHSQEAPRHPFPSRIYAWRAASERVGLPSYCKHGEFSSDFTGAGPFTTNAGQLAAYRGRPVDGTEPRYKFPTGFAKTQVLFNVRRAAASGEQPVIVVEGFFDRLKC